MAAIEHRVDIHAVSAIGGNLDHLPEPAALRSGAARTLAQFLAPDRNRTQVLGDLGRHGMHAGRKRGRAETVQRRSRAGAARVEHQDFGALRPLLRGSLAGIDRSRTELHDPQRAGAFGRHRIGQHFVQSAEHRIGQELSEHVPDRHRRRVFRV